MKWSKFLLILFFPVVQLQAQAPTFTITPNGTSSVCAGTSMTLNSSMANAFAGTSSYAVSTIPFTPYPVLGGNSATMVDDQILGPLPIGFQFCFYGNTYTQFYLGSNGWIGFTPGQTMAFTANGIPNTGIFVPRNCIMGPWMDWNPGVGTGSPYIKYQTQGIAPYRRLVVQWTNCPLYQCTASNGTFQIVIYESTNIIDNFITSKPVCAAWAGGTATQGVHNMAGNAAVTVPGRNSSVWTATNDGKRFSPNGPPSYTVNWTSNGFPIGTGNSVTTTINGPGVTRIIGRANFQCSNLILYDTLDVSIGGAANATFSVPANVCVGQAASFTYTGGVTGTGAWTFASGSPNSATGLGTQSTTWATPGTYNVSLTITPTSGLCAPGTSSQTVNVVAPPSSTFNLASTICAGTSTSISFTGSAPIGSTYSWNFGAGASPATAATVGPHAVSWSSSGTKTVSLTVTNGACSSTTTHTINVINAPTSTFTVSPSTVCVGSATAITFSGSAGSSASYTWNFGTGASPATASTAGPHSVTWSSTGTKNITLSVSEGGCTSAVTTQSVTVNSIPTASFVLPSSVCVGANASISYSGSAAAPPAATYSWNIGGGSPAPGNVQGPFGVNWSTAGTKTVSLTVSQNGCTSAPVSHTITVNPLPSVSIAAASPSVCVGGSVAFSVSGAAPAAGSTYAWSFGAGASPSTSTSSGPVNVSFANAGTATASLVVTTAGCNSLPATTNITVQAPPSVSISAPASGCIGSSVSISAPGPFAIGSTYSWNFGTGTVLSGSGAGPYQVQWATAGNQTVSLTVTSGPCTGSASTVIDIRSGPTAAFSAPTPLCVGQSGNVTFTGSANALASYTWNFGSGASPATATGQGPHAVSWSTSGSKTITLSLTDGGCTAPTISQVITITPGITSTFTTPSPTCPGVSGTVTYTGNAGPTASYSWNFGSGASPATAVGIGPHTVTWANAGSSTVSLTVSNGTCSSSSSQAVTVNTAVSAAISAPSIAGAGVPVSIGLTGAAQAGASYSWNFGSGASPATATGAGPHSVTYSNPGTATVTLVATLNGCTSTLTSSLAVVTAVTSNFTAPNTICTGANATITYTGNASPAATYTWDFVGGTATSGVGQGPHTVAWSSTGVKLVRLTVSEGGFTSSETSYSVTVNQTPTSTFSLPASVCQGNNASINYTGNAGPSALYAWNFGTSASPGTALSQGPHAVSWTTSGLANVTLQVVQNGCTSATTVNSISVTAPPTANFTLPASVCENVATAVAISGAAQSGVTYSWNFGSGASPATATGAGPHQVAWANAGSPSVSLTVSQGTCVSPVVTHSLNVIAPPSSTFSVSGPVCETDLIALTYTGNAGSGATFAWDYPAGTWVAGSATGPIDVQFPSAGIYPVSLQVTENGCVSNVTSANAELMSPPSFSISSPAYAAEGANTNITFTGSVASGSTYVWDFAGATVISGSGAGPYQVSWANSGIYQITCTVSNGVCAAVMASSTTEVIPNALATFTAESPICEGQNSAIVFTGSAQTGASYLWDFDNGTIVSGSNEGPYVISWSSPGLKTIQLTVTQMGIASPMMTQQVLVNAIPSATFTVSPTSCINQQTLISYTGTASSFASYTWDFGTGVLASSTPGADYLVDFPAEGNEVISLIVSENGCTSSSATQSTFVQAIPTADFTITPSMCAGETASVNYTGNADNTASYSWDFGGGLIISGSGAGPFQIEYPNAGTFATTLEVTYGGCTSALSSNPILVNQIPTATFTLTGGGCAGDTVLATYTGNAGSSAVYLWDFEATTSYTGSDIGPYQLTFPGQGTYPVGLFIEENGCQSSIVSQLITIDPAPVATFTSDDTVYVNQETELVFNGNAPVGVSMTWDYPSATYLTGGPVDPIVLSYDTPGTYSVSLEMSLGACTDGPNTQSITVLALPETVFSVSEDTICAGTALFITYDGVASSQAQFIWDFDGALVTSGSGAGPYQIQWDQEGGKQISLSIVVDGITVPATTHFVEVIGIPTASFTLPEQLCLGDTVQAIYSSITTLNAQFQWASDNAQFEDYSDPAEPQFSWDTPGLKTVMLSIADAMCISNPVSHTILVNPIPVASFDLASFACSDALATVSFDGTASSSASYDWDFMGASIISGSANGPFELMWSEPGVKLISLQIEDQGCYSDAFAASVTVRALPVVQAGSDMHLCSGDTITLSATNSPTYVYQWYPSAGLDDATSASPELTMSTIHSYVEELSYEVEVYDGFCSNRDTVNVALTPVPVASFIVPADACFEGNSFDFVNDGSYISGATFAWDLGPHTYTHSPNDESQSDIHFDVEGPQQVSLVISQFGCTSEPFTATVNVNPHPSATFTAQGIKGCVPLESSFVAVPSGSGATYTYDWSFGDGTSGDGATPQHTYIESGYMSVALTVSNEFGCSSISSQNNLIQVLAQPVAGFRTSPEIVFIGGDEMELISYAQNSQFCYYVIEGDTILGFTSTYSFREEGVYEITQVVVNAAGCTDEITHTVTVEYGTEFYIPSAFTPNNDGHNEEFLVVGNAIKEFSMIVFDRWGVEVFSSDDITKGWNGKTVNDEPMPEGVYVYRLEMRSNTNRDIVKNGQITLLR